MTLIKEFAEWLEDQSVGTVGTDMFISTLPEDVDDCIGLYETGGPPPNEYVPIEQPSVQALVRNQSYSAGRAIAESIFDACQRQRNFNFPSDSGVVGAGTYIMVMHPIGDVGYLQRDTNDRHEWSVNIQLKTR
jgi:hypothetical protein